MATEARKCQRPDYSRVTAGIELPDSFPLVTGLTYGRNRDHSREVTRNKFTGPQITVDRASEPVTPGDIILYLFGVVQPEADPEQIAEDLARLPKDPSKEYSPEFYKAFNQTDIAVALGEFNDQTFNRWNFMYDPLTEQARRIAEDLVALVEQVAGPVQMSEVA